MTTFKNIFTNWRVLLLLTAVLLSLISIHPRLFEGDTVTIRSVVPNSSALQAGIQNPSPRLTPLSREAIISLNGNRITSVDNYYSYLSTLKTNRTINVETNKGVYSVSARGNALGQVDLGLRVYDTPRSNLRKGLDLEGGTRVLLRPAEPVGKDTLDITIDNLKERLNVYGLSDVSVRAASDLSGENFILIEIAGVTEEEVKDLLARQGKFEAKVGNETVFFGGKKDITYVCRTADCSGIDPSRGCAQTQSGYGCSFFFTITLSSEAAERQAAITDKLSVVSEDGSAYLSENLLLYLDDKEVDSLRIGAELKGRATTSIQISGGGSGRTQQEAVTTTLQNMKRLQTIIITGSLPVKLEVEKMDTISPSLGKEFLNNIILVGALAVVAVVGVVLFRYRKARIIIPMVLTLLSEIIMVLGFAALVGWNLDLAGIAGIIIVAGTGVDSLIVITDETVKGQIVSDWKTRIKNAMFIVMGSYFINISSMLPLFWAGAGLLRGFALTTIAGLSFGVLIARPAYAVIVQKLLEE